LSAAVTWRTCRVWTVMWRVVVVTWRPRVAVGSERRGGGTRAVTWCVVCPHPSMRGGAHAAVDDERALVWPMQAFARGSGEGGGGGLWVGGGKKQRSDGAMFGNRWLPNMLIKLKLKPHSGNCIPVAFLSGAFQGTFWYQFRNERIPPE